MSVISKIFEYSSRYGWRYTIRRVCSRFAIKYIWGRRKYPFSLPQTERTKQREEAFSFSSLPLISIIVPLFHTPERFLNQMLDSVLNQTYPNWELCLADASEDNGLENIVREFVKRAEQQMAVRGENRIQYIRVGKNNGIGENSNAAAKMAKGEYFALLDHDDLLHPSALYEAAKVICQKKADFVYTDELSFVKKTSVVQSVHLKSDFRWEHLRSNNYICHFTVFSRQLFWRVGGFRQEYDGAQDYDLFFRMAEKCKEICHIPKVLYYWRLHKGSSAAGMTAKPYVAAAGKRALEQHLKRVGLSAAVEETELGPFYRVSYQVPERSRVLILAEDGDTAGWLQQDLVNCPYSVSVWCGKLDDKKAELCDRLAAKGICHQAVDYVVLVREGYHPVQNGWAWLTELLGCLQWWEHSLSGALVYNKKEQVEHAGFYADLQKSEGVYPRYHGAPKKENGYMNHLRFPRVVDYLYGAVLAMRWQFFDQEFQGQGKMEWERMFARETWFSLCSQSKEQGKYSVLTVQEPWLEGK